MNQDEATQLLTHMEWGDSVIWKSILATDSARQDPAVMARLHHIHVVQYIYMRMWSGEPGLGRELATFRDLEEVQNWARATYADLRAFSENAGPEVFSQAVEFPWADELVKWFGEARPATVQETIVQVAMHTSHHRGQLCSTIRLHGGEPPLVDFIGWVWMGKPAPDWPPLSPSKGP